ncbi:MAG: hypothetical protein ACRDSM_13000 [Pseudonocardiaceae bacterium]
MPNVVGQLEGASRLYRAWRAGEISRGSLRNTLPLAWSYDDQPMTHLEQDEWLELFRAAAPIKQPTNLPTLSFPLTLYRGSTHQRRRRMSWTTECDVARQFMNRHREYGDAGLYSVVVERDAMLAHLNPRRVEFEVVVDQAMLDEPARLSE